MRQFRQALLVSVSVFLFGFVSDTETSLVSTHRRERKV